MPNEVTSLLNALNSYITCPVCKDTNEIDIILTCGHLICQSCKTKRTKCPVCFCELSATRSHSPSIKFIKELCKELLKASTDEKNCVQSELAVENSITNLNLKGEQTTRNDSEKIEKKLNFGFKEDVESSNDNVKVTNETNLSRNKASNTKNCNDKKKIVVCRNYIRHREEQKVYRKILKGLGIVGIDKQIDKVKCKHTLNTREKELNVQLNSIISRLNDQYPNKLNNDNLDKSKLKYFSKMSTDSDTDLIQNIKVNTGDTKDGFGDIKHDLKRKGLDLIKPCGSSKRKKVSINGEGHSSKTFMKNINVTEDCIEFSYDNSVNLDKKLGGIVDETELVQRYLNPPMKGVGKEEIKGEIKSCSDIGKTPKSFLSNKSEFANKEPPVVDKTITDDNKADELSKSKINIISQFMDEINLSSEENDLQSDIMADMFHNVSNEIVIDGNTLRTSVKNTEVCDNSMNDSCDSSSLKNPAVNESSPCKPNNNKIHSLTIKTETESNSDGNNDFIEVSDSEDETKQNPISDSSQTMSDQTDIYIEDVNIMNCRIVLKDLAPLMLQSLGSSTTAINDNCAGKSNVEKSVNKDCTGKTGLKNKSRKIKRDLAGKKRMSGNANLIQSLSKVPSGQKRSRCDEVCNNFEGFTEDDILILTVKLALFKMNGSKYSKNSSSSSLFALDGKQILIKDVSQEESHPEILCCPHKISKSQSVQTDSELLTVTPGPSTSKIRPVSNIKLHGFEIENEKFMQNDVLDIRKPLTPNTPVGKESIASSIQSSPLRTTPVSRRQLSFVSPSFEKNLQYEDDGASTSNLKATGSVSKSSSNEDWQVLHCRMQHMIPSNHEDTLHSEFARSGISATQLTFTTCGLNSKEIALVTKLAQMTKSCLTKDFTHNTTHLVIGAAGRGRLEYYLAIAYRAFIVTMDWVTLCLALHKILPVTGFIPTEDEGPLKCLEPSSLPFVGFHVFSKILPTSSSYPIAEITKTLLSLGGARVLPNLDAFQTLQDGNYPRVFIYNSKSVLTQAILDKCATLHILPIQFMWVYESIGAFRAIPVMDFLDVVIHSRTLIRDYKIPDYLACSRYPRLEGEFHPQILDERYQRSL